MAKKKIEKLSDLTPDQQNFNRHTEFGTKLLEDSLRKFGAGRSILVDKDGNIIAGNGVTETAASIGMEDVIVVPSDGKKLVVVQRTDIDLDSPEGRELALADNMTALKGIDMDLEKVRESLSDDLAKAWGLMGDIAVEETKEASEDDFDGTKDEVPTICKDGDIWQLGSHRLMCGDSTDPGSVALLMNGEKADLWLTDPPYNVAVENSQGMTIANDNMSSSDFRQFLNKAFAAAYNVMADGCPFYVWFASKEHLNFEGALNDTRLIVRQELVWNKNHFILGRAHYQWKHEPCLYGWKGDSCRYFTNWRNRASVIEDETSLNIDKMKATEMRELLHKIHSNPIPTTVMDEMKPNKDTDHPTMKPVRLFGYQMQNSSKPEDIILDTFAGSGTTAIAAEQLGRQARLMELDPHYCDVILSRYIKLKGSDDDVFLLKDDKKIPYSEIKKING